jgi:hypothetical protein
MEINDEDKNGFMLCIHKLDRKKGLDLFLHTPGGNVAATESLVDYLRQMFGDDIRAFVPQLAMSAGTIIACACREIFMGTHSNLGPVDPQINGIPAYAVVGEITLAYEEMIKDSMKQFVWHPILSRYTPGFVQQCHWSIQRAKDMVTQFLKTNMLNNAADGENIANKIVVRLTDLSSSKGHDKHIEIKECEEMGLVIHRLEDDKKLQDLVLTVHHCYMYTLANTPAFKIIENHMGRRWIKMIQQQMMLLQQPVVVPSPSLAPSGPTH